ncbi:MAG: primosomal protein [Bacteroidetes bacterium]|nr:primosomal protein [Bacteroidota bacterium]
MSLSSKYINVIVPLPLAATFTYSVPDEWADSVRVGMRVVVPFGKRRLYTAIVSLIHTFKPETVYAIKDIVCLLDSQPVLRYPQLKFWDWIGSYYQAYPGDVFQAAVPAGLKLESETQVCINPDYEAETYLSDKEQRILDALSDGKPLSVDVLTKNTGIRDVLPTLKMLLEKNAVEVNEELTQKFRARTEAYVRLTDEARKDENLQKIFDDLGRAKKQLDLLMIYMDLSKCLHPKLTREVSKKELTDKSGMSTPVLNSLVEKGVLEIYKKEIGRLDVSNTETSALFPLNEHQKLALHQIEKQFVDKPVVLLHGITSSGKTEIYIHLIQKVLAEGNQVLYLVPEIALTTQLTSRLKRVFGNKLGVYHSKFSDAERVEIWNNVLNDKGYEVIIGVRSSVFLPFRKLGLLIVDEEHESSFKQYDPSPRYHARNAAIVLASMHGAKTLLGTATPSVETYFNATTGKYGLVELQKRHEEIELPEILVVDTKEAYQKKMMESHFSDLLLEKIKKALANKEQVILFQNRRGYAPYIECKACAYVPKCKNCDVSLTVHKVFNTLTCHYCGYTEPIPQTCPSCHTPALSTKGFGTEKIEDEIRQIFPEARVSRMDLDTTRSKKGYEKLITDFEQHKVDILIGTQMVTKGLDFEHVSLVGILNADNMLNFPDFRAHERAFQLMAQVSGRAGRRNKRGLVVLQTSQPEHPVIGQVLRNDYAAMFQLQSAERQQFKYPPYYRLIQITLRHRDVNILKQASYEMGRQLRSVFGERILGPIDPSVSRIQNFFIKQIILKIENEASPSKAKELLNQITDNILADSRYKALKVGLDVDPM